MPIKIHKVLSLGILAICILITGCDDEPETGYINFNIDGSSLTITPSITKIESAADDDGNKTFENADGFYSPSTIDVGSYTFEVTANIYDYLVDPTVYRDTTMTLSVTVIKDGSVAVYGLCMFGECSLEEL